MLDSRDRLVGIFGEREFLGAVFPGYLRELKHAGFVRRSLDDALEKRDECRAEPVSRHMNTEHVESSADFSDVAVAEIFLHHRVLLVPVTEDGRRDRRDHARRSSSAPWPSASSRSRASAWPSPSRRSWSRSA